jgi:hypothetical protein
MALYFSSLSQPWWRLSSTARSDGSRKTGTTKSSTPTNAAAEAGLTGSDPLCLE